ncbi:MAG: c-type cytochrome [Methyloversatilis sp.]|jgi:mono/diheme cytochrome c family protein|nr:c-type cytochrome [Methyloversatilis sp.]MBP6193000.1 c-type cytochrome [Methyloversatilis sp.]MBP9118012.1 c-type cytochrome [Methyloversatilis sp.]
MNRTSIALLCMSLLLAACSKAPEAEPMASASSVKRAPVAATPAPTAPASEHTPSAAAAGDVVKGWKAWRAAACERCHGAAQEGMVGPSLIASLKVLSRDEFRKVLLEGRLEKGMPSHPYLEPKLDDLYAYLKGRSDGSIANVRPDGA